MSNEKDWYDELDEMIDEETEAALDAIWEEIMEDEEKVTMLDPLKLQQMKFVYAVLKEYALGNGVKFSHKMFEPFKTMGSISVEAKRLDFYNTEWFCRAAEFASNVEIYPLTKDGVRMTFTFHDITKPIE